MNNVLKLLMVIGFTGFQVEAKDTYGDSLVEVLRVELNRNFEELGKADPLSPYFIAYRLNDTLSHSFSANKGGVVKDKSARSRYFSVEARVGDARVDNTHPMRDNLDFSQWEGYQNVSVPLEGNLFNLRRNLRTATDYAFRAARDQYAKITANIQIRPVENDSGLDFAPASPVSNPDYRYNPASSRKDLDSIYSRILAASRTFNNQAYLYASQMDFNFQQVTKRLVTTEGTELVHQENLGNITFYVETKAPDGMILWLTHSFFFKAAPTNLSLDTLNYHASLLLRRLDTLRTAPVLETYVGPVLLKNVAAAVFIHEVFGHRVEGHRQKAVDEGQTFVSKINQSITSPLISVFDDPTLKSFSGLPLNGHYSFDDEGIPSRRVDLIRNGVFKNFLLGRSVLSPKGSSNAHGRGVLGQLTVARMGNTILETKKGESFEQLRRHLRDLLRKNKKPFGLLLFDISGGFTYTGRDLPQSFRVEPLFLSQVFADGRPDRVVRGADALGTPLISLRQITAVGDDPAVFNGYCGAESGWLPVSAISPSLLLESMEFESRSKDQNLPPILNPPRVKP